VATQLAGALGFLLSGAILSGVTVDGFWSALLAAVVVGVIDAVAWPAILRITLPLTVLTLGLGVLVLNGAVVMVVAWILPGVEIARLVDGVLVTLICTALAILVAAILAIDQEERVMRHLVRRATRTAEGVIRTDVPGVLFLEIDGLAFDVLRRAMRDGNAPALARWAADGSLRLLEWETDWSSQTGACQAGLLHGDNDDMPAFRWWEKDAGRAIVTNPARRRRARAAHLGRARAAARRRREPREHPLGRRAALPCSR
jgi:uncharacterized membrane protein YvlD (DUF360 family)